MSATAMKKETKSLKVVKDDIKQQAADMKQELEHTRAERLAGIAVLAIIDTRFWTANKKAKKEADEITKTRNAQKGMVHASKRLLAAEKLNAMGTPRREAKALHKKLTTPWRGEKVGLLPNDLVFRYRHEMAAIIARHDRARDEFVPLYPALRDAAIEENGDLLSLEEYPDPDDIADRFSIVVDWELLPPVSCDIRSTLLDAELEFVFQNAKNTRDRQIKDALGSVFDRMFEVTAKMKERLEVFKIVEDDIGNQSIENDFKRSLITNITDVLDLVPALNVFEDPNVKKLATEMRQKLTCYNFETLKESEHARETTLAAAQELYEKFQDYL